MQSQKTLFVVGAGASTEIGLPLGVDLKNTVAEKVNIGIDHFGRWNQKGDPDILEGVREYVNKKRRETGQNVQGTFIKSGQNIRQFIQTYPSIDSLLSSNKNNNEFQILAKMGIVKSILEAEGKSLLPGNVQPNINSVAETWFGKLFLKLSPTAGQEGFKKALENIHFIVFNYDRCLEHYLLHAVMTRYFEESQQHEAKNILKPLNIIHPYGTVGDLPWINPNDHVSYGDSSVGGKKLLEVSNKISTFSDEIEDKDMLSHTRSLSESADRIIFLGFHFHD